MYDRVYNFSAGPAVLPEPVLEEVKRELMNYRGCGMSVMELSHRGKVFRQLLEDADADLRTLLDIPEDYTVLFLQGGGTQQFAMVPLNLAPEGAADYIISGTWSENAFREGQKFLDAKIAGRNEKPFEIPDLSRLKIRKEARYLYFCENETIQGTCFPALPPDVGVPLVADQSSMFLSKPCAVRKYGLIFAGVQKNVGPAGMSIVIIRNDLIREDLAARLPACLSYYTQAKAGSLYNTPNCWSIYVCGKIFRHLLDNGGLEAAQHRNEEKAKLLYDFLDSSRLFRPFVREPFRSRINVTFSTPWHTMDQKLIQAAEEAGLVGLAGHKAQGGLRASLYNAMPREGVVALIRLLERFEREEG